MGKEGGLLILKTPAGIIKQWPLDRPDVTIGRLPTNDIVLETREVSRRHARIWREAGHYWIQDCGSTNGTFLNGRRLANAEKLEDGSEIWIPPSFRLVFVDPCSAAGSVRERESVESLYLDRVERRVWVRGQEITPPLSPAQFALLSLLAEQPGRAYARDEIIRAVWPDVAREGVSNAALDALVRRLRRRLREVDDTHQYVSVVRGYGFRLDLPGQ